MTELLSAKQMRESDALAINNNEEKSRELMYKAALGVYNNVKWHGKIGIVCGKGNNGGDGFALALILKENGIASNIILALGEPKPKTTASYYFEKCQNEITIKNDKEDLSSYDILVDAIFGTGFEGNMPTHLNELALSYNSSKAYKVSIDINSGLNSDTGLGETSSM